MGSDTARAEGDATTAVREVPPVETAATAEARDEAATGAAGLLRRPAAPPPEVTRGRPGDVPAAGMPSAAVAVTRRAVRVAKRPDQRVARTSTETCEGGAETAEGALTRRGGLGADGAQPPAPPSPPPSTAPSDAAKRESSAAPGAMARRAVAPCTAKPQAAHTADAAASAPPHDGHLAVSDICVPPAPRP